MEPEAVTPADDVGRFDASLRPCAFLRKPHEGFKKQSPTVPVVRTLEFMLYVYVNAKPVDQGSTAGADQIDEILDALESALRPSGPGVSDNRKPSAKSFFTAGSRVMYRSMPATSTATASLSFRFAS